MSGFAVNDKAVCVDDSPGRLTGIRALKAGALYVIEDVSDSMESSEQLVDVVGIYPRTVNGRECGWCASRFRKLEDVREENRLRREQEVHV